MPDHRGAAPERMRGRGENCLVQHVLPVAGKLLLGGNAGGDGMFARPPAPATTTASLTLVFCDCPIDITGRSRRASACTSPKPVS